MVESKVNVTARWRFCFYDCASVVMASKIIIMADEETDFHIGVPLLTFQDMLLYLLYIIIKIDGYSQCHH